VGLNNKTTSGKKNHTTGANDSPRNTEKEKKKKKAQDVQESGTMSKVGYRKASLGTERTKSLVAEPKGREQHRSRVEDNVEYRQELRSSGPPSIKLPAKHTNDISTSQLPTTGPSRPRQPSPHILLRVQRVGAYMLHLSPFDENSRVD